MKLPKRISRFWYYGLDKADYGKCLPKIKANDWRIDRVMSFIGFFIMTALFMVSFFFQKLAVFTIPYGVFAGIFALLSLLFLIFKERDWNGVIGFYVISGVYYAFGMVLSFAYPSGKSAIIQLELALLPMLFADKPLRSWAYSAFVCATYSILVMFLKDPSIRFEESFNAISLTVMSLITHWIMGEMRVKGYLASYNNEIMIGELQGAKKQLEKESSTDALTGLLNRRSLYSEFSSIEKKEARRPSALFMIDIDHFKQINDTKGHLAGDRYLASFGSFLQKEGDRHGFVGYRYGGEEFICLVYEKEGEALSSLAEALKSGVKQLPFEDDGHITISLGYTEESLEKSSPLETWLDHADQSVYSAKNAGRDCVKRYLGK